MHANEAFDSVTAPVRAVFGHVATSCVKDDGPAAHASVYAVIHRLSDDIEANTSCPAYASR